MRASFATLRFKSSLHGSVHVVDPILGRVFEAAVGMRHERGGLSRLALAMGPMAEGSATTRATKGRRAWEEIELELRPAAPALGALTLEIVLRVDQPGG